jgi:autophagy-related protein 2
MQTVNVKVNKCDYVISGASMFESMWSSMTSSMQLAEECLKEGSSDGKDTEQPQPLEGLELFAQAIDSSMFHVFLSEYNILSILCFL